MSEDLAAKKARILARNAAAKPSSDTLFEDIEQAVLDGQPVVRVKGLGERGKRWTAKSIEGDTVLLVDEGGNERKESLQNCVVVGVVVKKPAVIKDLSKEEKEQASLNKHLERVAERKREGLGSSWGTKDEEE